MASGYSDLSEIQKASRTYGVHQKPPKINLLNEKPRRESLIEQQLSSAITRSPQPNFSQDKKSEYDHVYGSHQYATSGTSNRISNSYIESKYDHSPRNPSVFPGLQQGATTSGYQQNLNQPSSQGFSGAINRNVEQFNEFLELDHLEADLVAREAALKREIAYLNQYQNPWSKPRQIRDPRKEPQTRVVRSNQRWVRECPSPSTSRPTSRASSTRSTTEVDLLEKADKLLQEVEEMERKPLNKQQILIEGGIKNLDLSDQGTSQPSSVHTAIIKVPRGEVNNKSPLPFSYDNFSTLGVRGNIASVGAAEPETPYPPIFPTIKRSPTPMNRR